jgi:hypothetical protein
MNSHFDFIKKNIIFEDNHKFEYISNSNLEKIKDNQINNMIIDLIIVDIFSDKTLQEQFSKYLITSPETTKRLKEDFINKSKENLSKSKLLAKYQMTNLLNKEFLIFFDNNFNKKESYSQLIIINNLNLIIEKIVNKDFNSKIYEKLSANEKANNNNNNDSIFKFCFMIIDIIYEPDNDKQYDYIDNKSDINFENLKLDNKLKLNNNKLSRLENSIR